MTQKSNINFSATEKFNPETKEGAKGFLTRSDDKFKSRELIRDLLNFIPESLIKHIKGKFNRELFLQKVGT